MKSKTPFVIYTCGNYSIIFNTQNNKQSLLLPGLSSGTRDHLSTAATSVQWPPQYSGHSITAAISVLQPRQYSGHPSIVATPLLQPPQYCSHASTVAIPV